MKKGFLIILFVTLVVSASFVAYAWHPEPIRPLPYESILKHKPWPEAGDLRYHITKHMPYEEWAKWPGKGELYPGKEPHGSFLTTYVNDIALDSINKANGMAYGSIIVKENYDANKKPAALTVMYKVKDYNPDAGDWFWAKYDPEFNILAQGKIQACITCHSQMKDNDYIFSGKVKGK